MSWTSPASARHLIVLRTLRCHVLMASTFVGQNLMQCVQTCTRMDLPWWRDTTQISIINISSRMMLNLDHGEDMETRSKDRHQHRLHHEGDPALLMVWLPWMDQRRTLYQISRKAPLPKLGRQGRLLVIHIALAIVASPGRDLRCRRQKIHMGLTCSTRA